MTRVCKLVWSSWVAGMLRCPRHLPSLCNGRQAGSGSPWRDAAALDGPPCYAGSLGTSVGQESWERGGGKPQLLRLNVPAAATSGLGRPQRELELHTPADLPSSRAEAKSDRAAHSANFRPTGPTLGLFPLPPRPESNFVGIALFMHKA